MYKTFVLFLAAVLPWAAAAQSAGLPQRLQRIGVRLGVVAYRDLDGVIATEATLAAAQPSQAVVVSHLGGWVEQVYVDATYTHVRTGQPLLTLYSPGLLAAEEDYLAARGYRDALAASPVPGIATNGEALLRAARLRLAQEQVPPEEQSRLERTGVARATLTLLSPVDGVVLQREVLPQQSVSPSDRLYTIARLSPIWALARIQEGDLERVRPGALATFTFDALPGRTFHGRVDLVEPEVDPATRTAAARIVLANADRTLTPGMFASVHIDVAAGRRLAIPAAAVLQSADGPRVLVAEGGGAFTPRRVRLGALWGGDYEVLGGLRAGERIALSAQFLLDADSQLSAALGSYTPPPPGVSASATPAATGRIQITTSPSPARSGENQLRARLTSAGGAPLAGAQVTADFSMPAMPAMGMPAMHVSAHLADQGGGNYSGSVRLDSPGDWQVSATARSAGQVVARLRTTVRVAGGQ